MLLLLYVYVQGLPLQGRILSRACPGFVIQITPKSSPKAMDEKAGPAEDENEGKSFDIFAEKATKKTGKKTGKRARAMRISSPGSQTISLPNRMDHRTSQTQNLPIRAIRAIRAVRAIKQLSKKTIISQNRTEITNKKTTRRTHNKPAKTTPRRQACQNSHRLVQ